MGNSANFEVGVGHKHREMDCGVILVVPIVTFTHFEEHAAEVKWAYVHRRSFELQLVCIV